MASDWYKVEDIQKYEQRLTEVLGEMKALRAMWSADAPEKVLIEVDMAERSISYLEGWVPRQLSRVKKAKAKADKEKRSAKNKGKS